MFSLYSSMALGSDFLATEHNLEEKLLGVSEAAASPEHHTPDAKNLPTVPNLKSLAKDFQSDKDGMVLLYGKRQKVTHPISAYGMKCFSE